MIYGPHLIRFITFMFNPQGLRRWKQADIWRVRYLCWKSAVISPHFLDICLYHSLFSDKAASILYFSEHFMLPTSFYMTNTVSDKRPPWDKRLLIFALTGPNIEKTLYKVPSVPNTLVLPVDIRWSRIPGWPPSHRTSLKISGPHLVPVWITSLLASSRCGNRTTSRPWEKKHSPVIFISHLSVSRRRRGSPKQGIREAL